MEDFDSLMDVQHKVPTVAYWAEDETEVETEVVTYVATAKSLIAWVRTILERTAALDVLVVLRRLDQLGCVQAQVILSDLTPPWLCRQVRGLGAENWLQLSKGWMENVVWTSKQSSNEFLTLHVQQFQNPSSKIKKRSKGNRPKKERENKEDEGKTLALQLVTCAKQIVATVHFDPKLLSREILERWFEVLFRPNVAKITKAVLIRLKD